MYSKNDYRYYLEHRMAEENFLAHYGVKGMKWGKLKTTTNYNGKTGMWTRTGGIANDNGKAVTLGKTRSSRTGETGVGVTLINTKKKFNTKNPKSKKLGRLEYINTGATKTVAVNTTTKKKRRKATAKRIADLVTRGY